MHSEISAHDQDLRRLGLAGGSADIVCMDCPDEATLLQLSLGQLDAPAIARLDGHMDQCGDCREVLAALVNSFSPEDQRSLPSLVERGSSVGRFIVLEALGQGGMGVVYSAYDPELDRKVALKFVRAGVGHDDAPGDERSRLLREARAIARVAHPNVVAVYDVGSSDDAIYIAMELVPGTTLREWLRERPRSRPEVLALFIQAARALAAAHAVGVVHRDFKPTNVLVANGRAQVADFGLARLLTATSRATDEANAPIELAAGSIRLTRTKTLAGTPAYMAPEQFGAGNVTTYTDQFSYCASLYEALCGQRPFAGVTVEDISRAVLAGRIREPPKDRSLPAPLRRILWRGLRTDPGERHPSMESLVRALEKLPTHRGRRWFGVGAGLVALATAAFAFHLAGARDQRTACVGAKRNLVGIWDDNRKRTIEHAFLATQHPDAAEAWSHTAAALDRYVEGWVAMHDDACEATQVRGEQSAELLDLRMECLGDHLREVHVLTDLLVGGGAVVEHAVNAVHELPNTRDCANSVLLKATERPADLAIRSTVELVKEQLRRASALKLAGNYEAAMTAGTRAADEAFALGYRPLVAEAHLRLAEIQEESSLPSKAEASLYEAVWEAEASHQDAIAADAAVRLVYRSGQDYERGQRLARYASAAIDRLPGTDKRDLRARLLSAEGLLLDDKGDHEAALQRLKEALPLFQAAWGERHARVGDCLNNIGIVLDGSGKHDAAIQSYRQALSIREETLGPNHAVTAETVGDLAESLSKLGRFDEAEPLARRALAIVERAHGPDHLLVTGALNILAFVVSNNGGHAEARQLLERALEIDKRVQGAGTDTAADYQNVGSELAALHDYPGALAAHQSAFEILTKVLGPDHDSVGIVMGAIGEDLLGLHDPARALPYLERGLAIGIADHDEPRDLTAVRLALADALWETGGDRVRARSLALDARRDTDPSDAVDRWLERHGAISSPRPIRR